MAKIMATIIGGLLGLLGLVGFTSPGLLGMICSPLHNMLVLAAGAAVVYFAQRGGPAAMFWGTVGIGAVFLLGGAAGFACGGPGTPGFASEPPNERLWVLIPRILEFGKSDHLVHLIFGIAVATVSVVAAAETPFRLRK